MKYFFAMLAYQLKHNIITRDDLESIVTELEAEEIQSLEFPELITHILDKYEGGSSSTDA